MPTQLVNSKMVISFSLNRDENSRRWGVVLDNNGAGYQIIKCIYSKRDAQKFLHGLVRRGRKMKWEHKLEVLRLYVSRLPRGSR